MSNCVPFWDFDENKNYVSIARYKVLNLPDAYDAAKLLYSIDIFVHEKINNLKKIVNNFNIEVRNKLELLINTPYLFQEMQISTKNCPVNFDGLNKPKNIKEIKNAPSIGKDGKLRAERRLIFLQLRDRNGNLKNLQQLESLVIHEITHTACNHVRWRDDDHGNDFKSCEHIISLYI